VILTVIEIDEACPADRFATWLTEPETGRQVTLRTVRTWAGEPVPALSEVGDGLLVLGGTTHAYDDASGLPEIRALLGAAATGTVPTLGICLGAQLLAVAAGGRVHVGAPPGREAGVIDVHPRPDAAHDALLGDLAADVAADHPLAGGVLLSMPSMHADAVVDLPAGATWLASSRLYPYQAFRTGTSAWGLQFHPEVEVETFAAWAARDPEVDVEAVTAQMRERDADVRAGGRALAHRFVAVMAAQHAAAAPVLA
jgi:GMP synthase (glutamine-hydrolysing)